jgi:hypothetical protein
VLDCVDIVEAQGGYMMSKVKSLLFGGNLRKLVKKPESQLEPYFILAQLVKLYKSHPNLPSCYNCYNKTLQCLWAAIGKVI